MSRERAVGWGVLALALYPPLFSLGSEGLPAVFKYFAADAFYYLVVADRTAESGFFTFDGSHPTNGFHPLWQLLLCAGRLAVAHTPETQLLFAFGASVALVGGGTALFATAVARFTGSATLALLASTPGFYAWLVPAPDPHVAARWAAMNGMETPLSVLCFGWLCWELARGTWPAGPWRSPAVARLSLLLTLAVLSRLDDVFLLIPFAAMAWWRPPPGPRWAGPAKLLALPAAALALYCGLNWVHMGTPLPLSGLAKWGGPLEGLLRNGYALFSTAFPFADWRGFRAPVWQGEAWRVLQMAVPAAVALLWLRARWRSEDPADRALTVLAAYVLLKAVYNFSFVGLWHQGYWYFAGSLLVADLLVARTLASLALPRPALPRWLAPAAAAALVWLTGSAFTALKAASPRHLANYRVWEEGGQLAQEIETRCPGCGLLSFDDGILAFSLGIPTLNGIGLMADPEAARARREGRLLELAAARGHRVLATLNYPFAATLDPARLGEQLAVYRHLEREDLAPWRFRLLYRDPVSGAVFIEFRRRPERPPAPGR